jgi:hypothetical protein
LAYTWVSQATNEFYNQFECITRLQRYDFNFLTAELHKEDGTRNALTGSELSNMCLLNGVVVVAVVLLSMILLLKYFNKPSILQSADKMVLH